MNQVNFVENIQIRLASPQTIRRWAERTLPNGDKVGEVTKSETINYRTFKPEMDGLFCERIFGPVKDWECHCGEIKGKPQEKPSPYFCPECGVEITTSRSRRYRLGYINLTAPVAHIWYLKGIPSYIALLLNISRRHLENIVYCTEFMAIRGQSHDYAPFSQDSWDKEDWEDFDEYLTGSSREWVTPFFSAEGKPQQHPPCLDGPTPIFKAPSLNRIEIKDGANVIHALLKNLDLDKVARDIRRQMNLIQAEQDTYLDGVPDKLLKRKAQLIRRLQLISHFKRSGLKPEWMILEVLPVLPPDLRPLVQLDGGRFATSDLNDLYRRVINRNNRFQKWVSIMPPAKILRSEMRLLQESVDSVLDNSKQSEPVRAASRRPLKSLADIIKGKQGRFRHNLLGKRVDYSGRSVIVVGPSLKLHQCGLPKEMAIELFHPFVIQRLIRQNLATNIRLAKKMIQKRDPKIWLALQAVLKDHPVLLNRAPTLHRLGIQAFHPILVDGRAIKLHPLVCPAFNADFDGDQMAVHVPLSPAAQAEAKLLMLASNNLLSPATGEPIAVPSQDMILGSYYMTTAQRNSQLGEGKYFGSLEDVIQAYQNHQISLHAFIWVRFKWPFKTEANLNLEYPLELRVQRHGRVKHLYRDVQFEHLVSGSIVPMNHGLVQWIRTTPGRIIFNKTVQQFLPSTED